MLTLVIALALGLAITRTRFGKIVRAVAVNPGDGLGARHQHGLRLRRRVHAGRRCSPGLAGALAAPVRSIVSGMGLSVVVESFIVTVIGGMGSVAGALVGRAADRLVRSFGTIGFPLFTEGLMFLFMAWSWC